MITIFTCPKPFEGHIGLIQKNAILSWKALHPTPEVILFGNEKGMKEIAEELSVRHIPDIALNRYGTPQLDDVYKKAYQNAHFDILCYVNADIILLQDFSEAIKKVCDIKIRFLALGQRWDIDLDTLWDFTEMHSEEKMYALLETHGKLHPKAGSDYFVFPKDTVITLPPLTVGRAGWDNWMIYNAVRTGIPTIDISPVAKPIHQSHDYKHVKDSTGTAYENPESDKNMEVVIGSPFNLEDTIYILTTNKLTRRGVRNLFTYLKLIRRMMRGEPTR